MNWQSINPTIAQRYGLAAEWGAYVTSVASGGPADHAGIQRGDIILSIGGVSLDAEHSFLNTLFTYQPGEQVEVKIMRGEQEISVPATLGEATAT